MDESLVTRADSIGSILLALARQEGWDESNGVVEAVHLLHDLADRVDKAEERIRQLLLVIDHAVEHHEGQLSDYEGEVKNAQEFLGQEQVDA